MPRRPEKKQNDNSSPLVSSARAVLEEARAHRSTSGALSLVVAVSGGEDSHVLLHLLLGLREQLRLELVVAHYDHALRPESKREAEVVEKLARSYGLPFVVDRAPERPPRENLEAWARRLRYGFLERARRDRGADLVVTAHHQNDQAETVLFRILSGRLLTDAQGIARFDAERKILRPLLDVRKREIEDYAVAHRLMFVVDPSNADHVRTRNKIRHDLIPGLEKSYNPQLVSSLAQMAERLAADEQFLQGAALEACGSHRKSGGLDVEEMRALPPALLWRVLAQYAEESLGEPAAKLGFAALQSAAELVRRPGGELRRIDLGFGVRFETSRGIARFFIGHAPPDEPALSPAPLVVPGTVDRRYTDGTSASISAGILFLKDEAQERIAELVEWTKQRSQESCHQKFAVEYFDFESVSTSRLLVRERTDGDTVQVFKRGERKLKKLFLERGIAVDERDRVPLVQAGREILWVPGVARSALAPIRKDSRSVLELRYIRG